MKNSMKSLLVAAAVTGLLGAATVVPAAAEDTKPATTQTDKDKHSCKGANGCSGKDAAKDTKAKKASTTKDKKAATASKDKNSCKGANGCSAAEEKKN